MRKPAFVKCNSLRRLKVVAAERTDALNKRAKFTFMYTSKSSCVKKVE